MTNGTCPECGRWLQVNKRGEIARRHYMTSTSAIICSGGKAIEDIYESSLPQSLDELLEANRKAAEESEEAF